MMSGMLNSRILASNSVLVAAMLIIMCAGASIYTTWRRMQSVRDGIVADKHLKLKWLHHTVFAQWAAMLAGVFLLIGTIIQQYELQHMNLHHTAQQLVFTNSVNTTSIITNGTIIISTTTVTTAPVTNILASSNKVKI